MNAAHVTFGSARANWVIAAAVLGSGIAFLDATVVNVALPAISSDLEMGVAGLQWVLDAYLVTLTALLLLGGSVGDVAGRRRVFVAGLIGFAIASAACGLAPNGTALIVARALQGAAGAFLVPGSLAIVSASFDREERGRAIGAWSGLAGIASAVGPLVGGWLIVAASWRWIFLINIPLIAVTIWIAVTHVPETKDEDAAGIDWTGATTATIGLAAATFALIEGSAHGGSLPVVAGGIGVAALIAFVVIEKRARSPMLPLGLFKSSQFVGANLTTLFVYAALGGMFFLLVMQLQITLGYTALGAGVSLLPITLLMLALSQRAGALAQRIGPQLPMTVGPIVAALGFLLLARIEPGASYPRDVLPAVAVFGLGLTLTVAPLTTAVLASVEDRHAGAGSGLNNAVARLGGLVAVAVLPSVTGIDTASSASLSTGFATAMRICAAISAVGGFVALVTVRRADRVRSAVQPSVVHPCHDPCVRDAA